jgi:LuxR family maltose regulon positive regulatory protein
MADLLVETKLRLPRPRRGTVTRPRLAAVLERASEAPVTLVSAPAGFGKTTGLSSWLTNQLASDDNRSAAWVSLDDHDRRAESFWTYVLHALDRAVPGSVASSITLLQSGQVPIDTVLAGVVNELSVHPGEVTVVLDDYHLADCPDVAGTMAFLVDHLPLALHLIISTRADPTLPLSRLRARGELVEVRAADLRFSVDEVDTYLNDLNGFGLGGDDVALLEARTEGWAAALQLAALSLRNRADVSTFIAGFAGDDRFVVDYLADEVLDRQPDEVRRFLLDTSILERLTGPLCDAISAPAGGADRPPGRDMLDLLERQNLFLVPLDDHRRWYRYHHLFADVLQAHLLQERPDDVPELHRRAGRWNADNGFTEDAVRHALAAGDVDTAANLVEAAIPDLRRHRRESIILDWADRLPGDIVDHRPVLAVGIAGALMASNDFSGVEDRLRDAERLLIRPGSDLTVVDRDELARLPAAIEVFRAGLALVRGDTAGAAERATRALETATERDLLTRSAAAALKGLAFWTTGDIVAAHRAYTDCVGGLTRAGHIADVLGCSLALADMELSLGQLREAERTLHRGLELAARHSADPTEAAGPRPMRGAADMLVALSRSAWHRNDLAAAADYLRRADELGEGAGLPQHPYRWRVAMARLRATERDWSTALVLLDEAERAYVSDFSPRVHPIHATRARVLAASGDVAGARAWARLHAVRADDELSYLREYEHLTLARVLLARSRTGETGGAVLAVRATELLRRLLTAAEAGGRLGSIIEIEALRARALGAAGDHDAALAALEHAVRLAEPDGWIRVLVDAGPGTAQLLHALAARDKSDFLREVLLATAPGSPALRRADALVAGSSVDPLSERERDVLKLLGSDLDGPGIARELVVSLHTVRTHTKHIYAKLGVTSRRAAVTKAHQLGILSRSPRS